MNILYEYAFYELGKDSVGVYANVIYNDNYIFGYLPYNLKGTVSSLDGIWINGNTGEVKTKEEFENSEDTEN